MELLKLLSANEIIAQIINFLLLFIVLRIFLWKKILNILDTRRAKIASEFKNMSDAQKEAEALQLEYQARLRSIEEEARLKIKQAIDEGKQMADEIHKQAYADAQGILEAAKNDIKQEIAKTKEELKDEIVNLTIKAAEVVIEERLTEADDKKIVEDFLSKIDKA